MTKENSIKYYGIHACLMLFEKRAEAIFRIYLDPSNLKRFSPLLKWSAQKKIAYHIIPTEELDKVSGSVHHEGICIVAKELPILTEETLFASLKPHSMCLIYLDGIENPHNLGSILRTAAHFGIPYLLGENLPSLPPSCCRIAKGAAEIVQLVTVRDGKKCLQKLLKKGFSLIATSSHRGESIYRFSFPKKTVLMLGSESKGVSPPLIQTATALIQIPGKGVMESLNVSVAAGLCMGAFCGQHAP